MDGNTAKILSTTQQSDKLCNTERGIYSCVIGVIYWCLIAVFIIGVRGIITGKIIVVQKDSANLNGKIIA